MNIAECSRELQVRLGRRCLLALAAAVLVATLGLWCGTEYVARSLHLFIASRSPLLAQVFTPWSGVIWSHAAVHTRVTVRTAAAFAVQRKIWFATGVACVIAFCAVMPWRELAKLAAYFRARVKCAKQTAAVQNAGLLADTGVIIGAWPCGVTGLKAMRTEEPVLFLHSDRQNGLAATLATWNCGGIIFDDGGSLWRATEPARTKRGFRSRRIELGTFSDEATYDPIALLRSDAEASPDAENLARELLGYVGRAEPDALEESVMILLAALLTCVRFDGAKLRTLKEIIRSEDPAQIIPRLCGSSVDWVATVGATFKTIDQRVMLTVVKKALTAASKLDGFQPEQYIEQMEEVYRQVVDPAAPVVLYFTTPQAVNVGAELPLRAVFSQLRMRLIDRSLQAPKVLFAASDVALLGPRAVPVFGQRHATLAVACGLRADGVKNDADEEVLAALASMPVRVRATRAQRSAQTLASGRPLGYREVSRLGEFIGEARTFRVFEPLL